MDAINQPLLDVRDLSVAFRSGGKQSIAVDKVSFSINRGECVALVGESGSGKSVSALSVLKLLPYPTASHPSGSIRFKGRELLTLPEHEIREVRGNDVSIIFQEPMTSLNPLHTIEAQIGEALLLHSGMRGKAARARTRPVVSGAPLLLGVVGDVIEFEAGEGWANVAGERWRVRASQPLQRGQRVAVTRVDGLTLEVKPTEEQAQPQGATS